MSSGQTPPRLPVTTNLTATTAVKSGLLGAYLFQTGWQSQYGSDITLHPGTTYVAYDPMTGLNWAFATFDYNGAGPSGSDGPGVGMQDGGNTGYFYQLPAPGSPSSAAGGWVEIGNAGAPFCISRSFVPSDVIGIWGLSDNPLCATATTTSTLVPAGGTVSQGTVPTLGRTGARFEGRGFGQVKPSEVFLGGDPTGDILDIAWSSWGGPEASGTGTSFYVAPNEPTSAATRESATIIAFDRGICDGTYMYESVEWYYPQHGGTFSPSNYVDACTGDYVGSP